MKVAVLGGGPAGLYFAISMKLRDPGHEVTVIERNRADDTFGWGVVLSAETLENLGRNDPVSADWIRSHFAYWDDVADWHRAVPAPSRPGTASAGSAESACSSCCRGEQASSASISSSEPRPPIRRPSWHKTTS